MTKWKWSALLGVLALAAISTTVAAGAGAAHEAEDVLNQGGAGTYAADAATLTRLPNGLNVKTTIPTPESGTYVYPDGAVAGAPEVFTAWAFVFNYPDQCDGPCDGNDIGDTAAQGGVYNVAGHVNSGSTLTMSGHISTGAASFAGAPLQSPGTAEVHVAVAPHGQLDPSQMPAQISTPIGSPFCGCWWVAIFD